MGLKVGIDLGTTYSAVAVFDDKIGQTRILKNSNDKNYTPSVIHIENGIVTIGDEAKQRQASGDLNTASFYKSMMGEKGYSLYLDGKEYTPEELSGLYLKELIKDISEYNNVRIDSAVITCPAYFNEFQRKATENAGVEAGLKVLKLINEPTAAIIAYGLTGIGKKNVMVYDLGGGTFDVTIAEVDGTSVRVLTTNGNHQLGGKDWDLVISEELRNKFYAEFNVNVEDYPEDYYQLKVQCEDVKKRLTSLSSTTATIQSQGYTGKYTITREFFESGTYSLLNETILLINKCFAELSNEFSWKDIDEVVLVGGSTRMLQVGDFVRKEYGREPVTKNIDVDTIVAVGAAMQAVLCVDERLTLGGSSGGSHDTAHQTSNTGLVITGASIQDITSHSLGMLAFTSDEKSIVNSIIIKKNSPYNDEFGRDYSFGGNQMEVFVLQGETSEPRDCTLLYKYIVSGFSGSGKTEFSVNFAYNQGGTVEVNARTKEGLNLNVEKSDVNESIEDLINRLLREREEQKRIAREAEVVFIVDTSGSMCGEPITKAKQACRDFVSELNLEYMKVSLIDFAKTCATPCIAENRLSNIESAISSLGDNDCGGCTSATPLQYFKDKFGLNKKSRVLVVLTDGEWSNQSSERSVASTIKNADIKIYAIGFGDADESFLRDIASDGGAKKIDLSRLSQTFVEIAGSIATEK
jgi:molecular chaperone DnaK (HSP70)